MALIRWLLGKIILFFDALFSPPTVEHSPEEKKRIDSALQGHALYQFEACPFCVKVRRFLRGAGISLPVCDAKQEAYRKELLAGGGKVQVPCLRIEKEGGAVRWLYESDEIISYLKEKISP